MEQVDQAIQQVTAVWEAMKIQTGATGTGEIRDANLDFKMLCAMVATLLSDMDNPVEQGVWQMWAAIEGVVCKSQWTV
ncbi:hypothetical protein BDV23DRAFT_186832 [Aspergillus alliaceus]|uniref:Uncharacterized protein n=1 Tax=Petromyces alliaceus TaxID=209559 RepID=A0A5N7BZF5_PETAA|nr:hypothetical protein BDV23DRAFT_186832 [Aspergillus alliaceus]